MAMEVCFNIRKSLPPSLDKDLLQAIALSPSRNTADTKRTSMYNFTYIAQPSRVVFAIGSLDSIAREVEALGCKRALVLCTPPQRQQAESVAALLGEASAGVYDGAEMH